jgi:hypothetical protein
MGVRRYVLKSLIMLLPIYIQLSFPGSFTTTFSAHPILSVEQSWCVRLAEC